MDKLGQALSSVGSTVGSFFGGSPAGGSTAVPTPPSPTTYDPLAGVVGPAESTASAAAADPADPSSGWGTSIANWLKGDVTGAKGALGTPVSALGTAGSIIEAINRWQLQQTLQNPAALASGASKLYQPMSAAMRRAIVGPVTAQAQETGQINAPGLYSQSVANALAPYQYQMQMNALNEYLRALQESEGAYPLGGGYGSTPGGGASIFGG